MTLKSLQLSGYFLAIAATMFTCANPPDYPDEPVITYKNMSRNTMVQSNNPNADSISLTFSFTDGNGDLGSDDSVAIFIVDGRDNFPKPPYKIPYIDEQGAGNGISGEITIRLNTTCCTFPNGNPPCSKVAGFPSDTLTYKISIRDRAGNISNEIVTPPIILLCQ